MKKKGLVSLGLAMVLALASGCGGAGGSGGDGGTQAEASKEPLRVAVQSYYCSSMVQYIQENKLDEAAGLDIEWVVFNGGAPINEAMGEWDVAVTGGAFVYALANYDCRLVAHQVDGTSGNYVVARKGDPIESASTKEEMAEIVKGKTLLTTFGATGHYTPLPVAELHRSGPNESNIMNLEISNIYPSWVAGEGDYAVLTEPWCYYDMDEMGSSIIATLESVGGELYESTVCTADAYENRYDDVVKFVDILYEACDALDADEELAVQTVVDWYENCGKTLGESEARSSVETKPFISTEEAKKITLGEFAVSYASWFYDNGLIDETGLENVKNHIATDVFEDALKLR